MRGVGLEAIAEVAKRPSLWPTALRQAKALAPDKWWARWPYLPLPDRAYMGFRLECMYGSSAAKMGGADLVGYLEWCRRMRQVTR